MVHRTENQVSWGAAGLWGWVDGRADPGRQMAASDQFRERSGRGWPSGSLLLWGSGHPSLCWDSAEPLLPRKLQTAPKGTCSVSARSAPALVLSQAPALLTQKLV